MQHLDIIIFAIVAVVIALRLRAVLGQRNEGEPRRPNPFAVPKAGQAEDDEGFVVEPKPDSSPAQHIKAIGGQVLAPESLAGSLSLIKQRNPEFDEKVFLQGARSAFGLIVGAYAKGDLPTLQKYLGPEVYAAFSQAVAVRQAAEQRMETNVITIKEAEVTRARLTGDVARLTVRFVSEQTNATYDNAGQLVEGDPSRREEIEDVWSFARNLTQQEPVWLLVETRV